jgi:hypothetical protein
MQIKTAVSTLTLTRMLSPALVDPCAVVLRGEPPTVQTSISSPACEKVGTNELTLICTCSPDSPVDADSKTAPLRSLALSMKPRDRSEVIFAACTDGVAEAMDVRLVQYGLEPSRISFQRGGPSAQTRSSELCAPQYIGFLRKARTETTA